MKKILSIISLSFLLILSGCIFSPQKFTSRINEGIYENYESINLQIGNYTIDWLRINFADSDIMKYVKTDGEDMVKDLYTIEERFYTVYDVYLVMSIEGTNERVTFEAMGQKDYLTTTEYVIKGITCKYDIFDSINITLADEDNDEIAEKIIVVINYQIDGQKGSSEEITLINIPKEHYIEDGNYLIYDNELQRVEYTIILKEELTKEEREALVERMGILDLNYKNIFYSSLSSYFSVSFVPENHNMEIIEYMDYIKVAYANIISEMYDNYYYLYADVYMHNPKAYNLTDENQLSYTTDSLGFLTTGVYTSFEQFEEELKTCSIGEEAIQLYKTTYTEEFFKDNVIIVSAEITTGSGSNHQELKSVYLKDNQLYLFAKMYFTNVGTDDMQSTKFGVIVKRSQLPNNLDDLTVELLYRHPKYDNHGLW